MHNQEQAQMLSCQHQSFQHTRWMKQKLLTRTNLKVRFNLGLSGKSFQAGISRNNIVLMKSVHLCVTLSVIIAIRPVTDCSTPEQDLVQGSGQGRRPSLVATIACPGCGEHTPVPFLASNGQCAPRLARNRQDAPSHRGPEPHRAADHGTKRTPLENPGGS